MAFSLCLRIALMLSVSAVTLFGAAVFVAGPSPVPPFGGTVLTFEGLTEGAAVPALGGVTFSQPDGGVPIADNKSFLFAYESSSGRGVLTGGPPSVTTTAGIIATFPFPVLRAGAFLSDTGPLGNYEIRALGVGGAVLESFLVTRAVLPSIPGFPGQDPSCDPSAPFDGTGCGVFVGFDRPAGDMIAIQFGPSSVAAGTDAFAIDDLRFQGVPEPASITLLGAGIVAILLCRRFRT